MPDLIQVADDLKNAPDAYLAQQMQSPTGSVPPWLVASEVQRREKLRDGSTKGQAPQSSVSQDLIRSLYARIPPTAGLVPQGSGAPPGMPPVSLTPGNGATLGPPAGTPPSTFRTPPRQMARGGRTDEDDPDNPDNYSDNGSDNSSDGDSPDIYNMGTQQPSRRTELERLYPAIPPPAQPQIPDPGPPAGGVIGSPAGPVGGGGGLAAVPGLAGAGPAAPSPPPAYPGFEPVPTPAPGAFGRDYRGMLIPVRQMPKPPTEAMAPVIAEHEQIGKTLSTAIPDFTDPQHTSAVKNWITGIYGEAPDTKDLKDEMEFFRKQAAKAKPSISGALMQMGTALMGSKEHNFGVALGQAGQHTLGWAEQQKNRAMQLEMYRLQAATQLANRTQQFKERVGADVVRGAEMMQQRDIADRQRQQVRYDATGNVIRQGALGYRKDIEKTQDEQAKDVAAAHAKTMSRSDANTLINSEDPVVAATARAALDAFHADDKAKADATAQIARETFRQEQTIRDQNAGTARTERLADAKDLASYKHSLINPKPTGKVKWDDNDTKNDASLLLQEQMDHVVKNPNGAGWIDETGKPIFMPSVPGSEAVQATMPDQLISVMKGRAQKVLLDQNNWNEFPRFNNNDPERKRVAGAIGKLPFTSSAMATISTGSQYGKPRGFGGSVQQPQLPPSPAPPPGQPQPPAQQPAQQPQAAAPPAPPPSLLNDPRKGPLKPGMKRRMDNGDVWANRNGQLVNLGRQ